MTSKIFKMAKDVVEDKNPPSDFTLSTIRSCIAIIGLTIVLWANANDFDATEGKSIALMILIYGGSEGLSATIKKIFDKSGNTPLSSE